MPRSDATAQMTRAGLNQSLLPCLTTSPETLDIDRLAAAAAEQWTGGFNPRPCTAAARCQAAAKPASPLAYPA